MNPGFAKLLSLLFTGPFVVLCTVAVYALFLLIDLVLRRERTAMTFLASVADGLEKAGTGLFAGIVPWGLALVVAAVESTITAWKIFWILGLLILLFAVRLLGTAVVACAVSIGRRLIEASGPQTEDTPSTMLSRFSLGLLVILGASAVPVIGWITVLLFASTALGAAAVVWTTRHKT